MIRRIYLKMTGPQILASVSSMLCLLIDSIVISRFLGVDAMSAYGLVSPMIIVVNACILMISCGAQVSAAAALGRGDMEDLSAGIPLPWPEQPGSPWPLWLWSSPQPDLSAGCWAQAAPMCPRTSRK